MSNLRFDAVDLVRSLFKRHLLAGSTDIPVRLSL
jgi:hypothetical protein